MAGGKTDNRLKDKLNDMIWHQQGAKGQDQCHHKQYHAGFGIDALICQKCFKILKFLDKPDHQIKYMRFNGDRFLERLKEKYAK